jgi:methionyl-tRNA formyltransferase
MGIEAMVEAVELIRKGEAPRIPQDEPKATYEPPCDDTVAVVDWKKPSRDLYNLIRGCDPQPGAHTTIRGEKVRFYSAKLHLVPTQESPGEILSIKEGGVGVAVTDGVIEIGKLRIGKGEKVEEGRSIWRVTSNIPFEGGYPWNGKRWPKNWRTSWGGKMSLRRRWT